MKSIVCIATCFFLFTSVFCQDYYVRGEVRDEAGNILQNVKIIQKTTDLIFRTGAYGTFGLVSRQKPDTLDFFLDGYRAERVYVKNDDYLKISLKLIPGTTLHIKKDKLASLTKDLSRDVQRKWFTGDETYTSLLENQFVKAGQFPQTGVSLNIDKASYSNIRRFLTQDAQVPPDAVRIEEMLNYFNLGYHQPDPGNTFYLSSTLTSCPWNENNQLYLLNLSAQKINTDSLPPTNLVFLIDVSGSMDMPNRLPLLKSAFKLLVDNLREKDTVSIVVYGGALGIMLQPTSGKEKDSIQKVIDQLAPGGATPGESGIRTAYGLAKHHFIKDGNNRVILATDGDFNVGLKTEEELDQLITQHRESGIYLTCLGVGMGNLKDSKIQTLARKGNGNYAYIDNYVEAEKVLLKEFTQTLYTVADKVFMNINFNPEFVKEYRLIGFDNKAGDVGDSLTEVEGGEIGPGFSLTAMFEIVPSEKNLEIIESGKFSGGKLTDILSNIKVEYSLPNDTTRQNYSYSSDFGFTKFNELERCQRFSTTIVMFGSKLRSSSYVKNADWNDILSAANMTADLDKSEQKEFVSLVQKAKSLYTKTKKKKRKARKEQDG